MKREHASNYIFLLYGSIAGIPLLMILYVIFRLIGNGAAAFAAEALLVPAFFVFGILSFIEIFGHEESAPPASLLLKAEGAQYHEGTDSGKSVYLNVKKFNPAKGRFERFSYKVKITRFTSVLDALLTAKAKHDNTLSIRYSCRMGTCGSCGMVVNGKPVLACQTNVLDSSKDGAVEIGPMQAHPLLKDLATNFDEFFEEHKSVDSTLYRRNRNEKYKARKVFDMDREEMEKFLPYSYCIMCGLCQDACPVSNSNGNFLGPQALAQVYRYHADKRDQKGTERLEEVDSLSGAWGCEFAGACSKACPKGVDPASAIQLLKSEIMKAKMAGKFKEGA